MRADIGLPQASILTHLHGRRKTWRLLLTARQIRGFQIPQEDIEPKCVHDEVVKYNLDDMILGTVPVHVYPKQGSRLQIEDFLACFDQRTLAGVIFLFAFM